MLYLDLVTSGPLLDIAKNIPVLDAPLDYLKPHGTLH